MERIEKPDEFTVCRFDGVTVTGVYVGTTDCLRCVNDRLKWRKEVIEELSDEPTEMLTLAEIEKQLKHHIVTVIINGPMHGEIYQCGNYSAREWWKIGDLDGYA